MTNPKTNLRKQERDQNDDEINTLGRQNFEINDNFNLKRSKMLKKTRNLDESIIISN